MDNAAGITALTHPSHKKSRRKR